MSDDGKQKKLQGVLGQILTAAVKATPSVRAVVIVALLDDPDDGEDKVIFGGQTSSKGTQEQLGQLLEAAPKMLQDLVDRLSAASKPRGSA